MPLTTLGNLLLESRQKASPIGPYESKPNRHQLPVLLARHGMDRRGPPLVGDKSVPKASAPGVKKIKLSLNMSKYFGLIPFPCFLAF